MSEVKNYDQEYIFSIKLDISIKLKSILINHLKLNFIKLILKNIIIFILTAFDINLK